MYPINLGKSVVVNRKKEKNAAGEVKVTFPPQLCKQKSQIRAKVYYNIAIC